MTHAWFLLAIIIGLMILVSHYTHTDLQSCLATTQFLSWQHSSSSHTQRSSTHWSLCLMSTTLSTQHTKEGYGCIWCKNWLSQWQTLSTLSSCSACFSFSLPLHSLASLWSVATGQITPKVLFMGQQCQAEPFIDSYHAPYKAKHRYWPGLLLVFRFALLLVFALNTQQDPSVNLLAIGNWNTCGLGLGQWWSLQQVMSRWPGGFICSELYHLSCCNLLC